MGNGYRGMQLLDEVAAYLILSPVLALVGIAAAVWFKRHRQASHR